MRGARSDDPVELCGWGEDDISGCDPNTTLVRRRLHYWSVLNQSDGGSAASGGITGNKTCDSGGSLRRHYNTQVT